MTLWLLKAFVPDDAYTKKYLDLKKFQVFLPALSIFDGTLIQGIEINNQFKQVLDFIDKTDSSIFLTGKAGTGKTTLLKHIRQTTYKQMAVVAPTGVAAINAGGSTIHSFFQFDFKPFVLQMNLNNEPDYPRSRIPDLNYNSQRLNIIRHLELLVIDEISMVRADLLDRMDVALRQSRKKWHLPFGGVQMLFIGDMHQLPPVVTSDEEAFLAHYSSPFFFDSFAVRNHPPVFFELQKIYRQNEKQFVDLLNQIRHNQLEEDGFNLLSQRYQKDSDGPEYKDHVVLTTHNYKADAINNKKFSEIKSKPFTYRAAVRDNFPEKNFPVEEELKLKVGARVMFLKNNPERNYYNGKMGLVSYLDEEEIRVRCDEDDKEIKVAQEVWQNMSYALDKNSKRVQEEILGTFTQYPLRLAWAITIHKSQGLTFNKLMVDAAESFSAGQVYVALSRCSSLQGLVLSSPVRSNSLHNDKRILDFSEKKAGEHELEQSFRNSHNRFSGKIITGLFDFSDAMQIRKDLAESLMRFKNKFGNEGEKWFTYFFVSLESLADVGNKFVNQLKNILLDEKDLENNSALNERIIKGSYYFSVELEKLISTLRNPEASTESREAANEMNPLLQQLFEELFLKQHLIHSANNGFHFNEYIRHKLNVKFPPVNINITASASRIKVSKDILHPALYKKLLLLRDDIVNEEQKPIYLVANNNSLVAMANHLPLSEAEWLTIPGFGKSKTGEYGKKFGEVIENYLKENNLDKNTIPKIPLPKRKSKSEKREDEMSGKIPVGETKMETFRMFESGMNIEQIAKERKYTMDTICKHLSTFVATGKLDVSKILSSEKIERISSVIEEYKSTASLNLIKSKLPPDYSFNEIRFVMAHHWKPPVT